MSKRKFARLGALSAAMIAALALVSSLVAVTGAYWTDVNGGGTVNRNNGTVKVDVNGSPTTAPVINFDNLMPGEVQTATVTVQNTGTGTEDIYIVFDNANGAWSWVNDLGAYGTFVIDGTVYDNLNNKYPWGTDSSGQIISSNPASSCYNVVRPAQIKFLPHYIKVASGLTTTASKAFDISFNYHACMSDHQGEAALPLNFSVVAFQAGVDPTSTYNGAGKIVPLVLPYDGLPGTFQDR
jgi:hypothetical protein